MTTIRTPGANYSYPWLPYLASGLLGAVGGLVVGTAGSRPDIDDRYSRDELSEQGVIGLGVSLLAGAAAFLAVGITHSIRLRDSREELPPEDTVVASDLVPCGAPKPAPFLRTTLHIAQLEPRTGWTDKKGVASYDLADDLLGAVDEDDAGAAFVDVAGKKVPLGLGDAPEYKAARERARAEKDRQAALAAAEGLRAQREGASGATATGGFGRLINNNYGAPPDLGTRVLRAVRHLEAAKCRARRGNPTNLCRELAGVSTSDADCDAIATYGNNCDAALTAAMKHLALKSMGSNADHWFIPYVETNSPRRSMVTRAKLWLRTRGDYWQMADQRPFVLKEYERFSRIYKKAQVTIVITDMAGNTLTTMPPSKTRR